MKHTIGIILGLFTAGVIIAQVSGNAQYARNKYNDNALNNVVFERHANLDLDFPTNAEFELSVKGLANVKVDTYVAIFSVVQEAENTEEVDSMMEKRLEMAIGKFKTMPGVELYIDMISFVPVYDNTLSKKIFSNKTKTEVPEGFQLKKNVHVKYSNPKLLNDIISQFAKAEIYDLVRVDCFSTKMEAVKKELLLKAKTTLLERLKNHESLMGIDADTLERHLVDGFKIVLPVDMYQHYQAYDNSYLNTKKISALTKADRITTMYYQPITEKEFDFVINPVVMEPVIQVMYEVKLKGEKYEQKVIHDVKKEFMLINPNGSLNTLNLK